MKYLYLSILIILLGCQGNTENSLSQKLPSQAEKIIIDTLRTGDILVDSINYERDIIVEDSASRFLNDSIKSFIKSFGKTNPKWYEYNKRIVDDIKITSHEKYIACDSIVYLYNSPYSTDNDNNKIIDTLSIFDTVIVPYFNNKPFYHKNAHELYWENRYFCYHDGKFGFFKDYSCIDSSRISQSPNSSFIQYDGDKYVLKEKEGENFFILPSSGYNWSFDNSHIVYTTKNYINGRGIKHKLFCLTIPEGTIKFLSQGHNPFFIDSTYKIFFFYDLDEKEYSNKGLSLYDLKNNTIKHICETNDSISFYECGPDFCTLSDIISDNYLDKDCFSIKLYENVMEPNKSYRLYFTSVGDSLDFVTLP